MEIIPEEHKETIVRRLGRSDRWPGDGKTACVFKQSIIAGPAQLHFKKERCVFCDDHELKSLCKSGVDRKKLRDAMMKMNQDVRKKAFDRIDDKYQEFFKDVPNATPRKAVKRKRQAVAEAVPVAIGDVSLEDSKTSRHTCSTVETVSSVTECLMFAIERACDSGHQERERSSHKEVGGMLGAATNSSSCAVWKRSQEVQEAGGQRQSQRSQRWYEVACEGRSARRRR